MDKNKVVVPSAVNFKFTGILSEHRLLTDAHLLHSNGVSVGIFSFLVAMLWMVFPDF